MTGFLLWIFLLALWNVILFFARDYGVNVVLFIIPLMGYLYYVLKKGNKIKNKCGLLYMIPIILLSITYLLFNNELFMVLNFFAIPILIALMIIYTTGGTYKVFRICERVILYLFEPFKYIARLYRVSVHKLGEKLKMTDRGTKILKTIIIVVPITIFILALLSSADMVFGNIFGKFLDKLLEVLKLEFFDHLLGRITLLIIMFILIGCTTMYIIYENKKNIEVKKEQKNRDLLTVKTLLIVLNIVYVVFDFIQIKSLLLHSVSSSINYAVYARQGFFELLVVSFINLSIILITRRFETKENENEFKLVKIMSVLMIFLTLIIIASSFLRMHLYEAEFGYTVMRLLVFTALITEAILMIPTVMYIFNSEVNIVKSYMIITLVAYMILNFINMDYIIAKRNVNRFYARNDIDLIYLKNYETDNIPVLIKLYNSNLLDENGRRDLSDYLETMKENTNEIEHGIFEFNLSQYKAKKELNKIETKHYYEYRFEDYDY